VQPTANTEITKIRKKIICEIFILNLAEVCVKENHEISTGSIGTTNGKHKLLQSAA
jgi:hypothetical protein